MIYSPDVNRICAVCGEARPIGNGEMYCEKKKKAVPENGEACKKFNYDILKRRVRRMRRIKTDYDPKDFQL